MEYQKRWLIFSRTGKHFGLRSGPTQYLPTGWGEYWVSYEDLGSDGIAAMFETLLTLDVSRHTHAIIDAVSDDRKDPAETEEARLRLVEMGEAREAQRHKNARGLGKLLKGDPQMGIELDLRNPEHFDLLRTFGVYSIHVEIYGRETRDPYITAHDSGTSIGFLADDDFLERVIQQSGVERGALRQID